MSEAFYVLSGEIHAFDGERWFDVAEGDYLYVPPGGLHSFGNISGEPAGFLMLFAPGGSREGYFEGLGRVAGMTYRREAERLAAEIAAETATGRAVAELEALTDSDEGAPGRDTAGPSRPSRRVSS
jgi:hypothetical protein